MADRRTDRPPQDQDRKKLRGCDGAIRRRRPREVGDERERERERGDSGDREEGNISIKEGRVCVRTSASAAVRRYSIVVARQTGSPPPLHSPKEARERGRHRVGCQRSAPSCGHSLFLSHAETSLVIGLIVGEHELRVGWVIRGVFSYFSTERARY